MGFLDRLFGSDDANRQARPVPQNPYGPSAGAPVGGATAPSMQPPKSDDELAIERYRYLLRTAPPETIEQVHAEAFAKLSPAQRQQVLAELRAGLPPQEQPRADDPRSLARAATRAEYTNPGFMERTFGSQGRQGPSFGSMVGGSLLGTVAGYVIGSALVSSFLAPSMAYDQGYQDGSSEASGDAAGAPADAAAEPGASAGWGGDGGGFGDFGGGDFGGGDFGF